MFVDDLVFVKLSDVRAIESMHVGATELSDRLAVEGVNVSAPDESDRFARCRVNVVRHSRHYSRPLRHATLIPQIAHVVASHSSAI